MTNAQRSSRRKEAHFNPHRRTSIRSSLRRLLHHSLLLSVCLATGCGTLKNGRGWGQDALWPVQGKRVADAARRAIFDPMTWIPAAGALVFAIDDFDERTAHWASTHQPLFGSRRTADDLSDYLRNALAVEAAATALLTPSGDDALDWHLAKAKGLGVEFGGGIMLTSFATDRLKDAVDRERPDQSDRKSFPSGHASIAFSAVRLSNRNLDSIAMKPWLRTSFKAANITLAGATAWARVEADKHFPTDVLAGAALGNLVTTFIHDAFLNLPEHSDFGFYLEPSPRGVSLTLSWDF
jgi:membrane-associated phospholipid phosphatase